MDKINSENNEIAATLVPVQNEIPKQVIESEISFLTIDNVFRDTIDSEPSIIYSFLKRAIDIGGAVLGIVILTPVLIILGLLIKLEDPKASIFFIQERVGNRGKLFRMYKFRSMIVNAEDLLANLLVENEVTGAMFKMKNDPRVTKIGRFIRKTSLDEIPQLINVIKGEMSLVGPRPPLPREVMLYEEKHFQRLTVKPGCTGLWQVTARNEVGFEEMVNLDLLYIKERTLLLDIKLILKTIQVMVLKKGI